MPTSPKNLDTALSDEIQTHIKRLTDFNPEVRVNAEKALQRMGTKAVDALIEEFNKGLQLYQRRELRAIRIGTRGLWLGLCLFLVMAFTVTNSTGEGITWLMSLFASCIIGISLLCRVYGSDLPTRLKALYNILTQMDDPRLVSILLGMHSINPTWSANSTLN